MEKLTPFGYPPGTRFIGIFEHLFGNEFGCSENTGFPPRAPKAKYDNVSFLQFSMTSVDAHL